MKGRAIVQAVSCRLGFCPRSDYVVLMDKVADFLRVLRFPLKILIPPNVPTHQPGTGTIVKSVADVPSGLSLTPPNEIKKNYMMNPKAQTI
jgi:hypothetical protein